MARKLTRGGKLQIVIYCADILQIYLQVFIVTVFAKIARNFEIEKPSAPWNAAGVEARLPTKVLRQKSSVLNFHIGEYRRIQRLDLAGCHRAVACVKQISLTVRRGKLEQLSKTGQIREKGLVETIGIPVGTRLQRGCPLEDN
ncbi:hypothetical protein K0M31_013559 [Melipona bicolor]|uniref:Uncharacterized protein n=1 Tax=Melipona bicolor TaxID=60889 RepID=A0AA40FHG1_9HYME|nr:hypothetical protein K0M31_013559 [Melipona bicolor]